MKIKAQNFKWMNGEEIDLRKVTVMIGENSGGKSTISKLLLFLKQSFEMESSKAVYQLNGPYVKLGQYRDVIANHDVKSRISIACTINKDRYLPFFEYITSKGKTPSEDDFERIEFGIGEAYGNDVNIEWILPKTENDDSTFKVIISVEKLGWIEISPSKTIDEKTNHYSDTNTFQIRCGILKFPKLKTINVEGRRNGLLISVNSGLIHEAGGEELGKVYVKTFGYFLLALPFVSHIFRSIEYINPLNSQPQRYVDISNINSDENDGDYGSAATKIASSRDGKQFENTLAKALSEIGIADSFVMKKSRNMPFAEFIVEKNGIESNAVDLGFGVGLQIGVLSKVIQHADSKDKIFIIEQPEVHLHPKLQSKFLESLLRYGNESSFLIETHSDHLVKMLQVLTKRGEIKNTDSVVYYFRSTTDVDRVSIHQINEQGYIDPIFPTGFYDNGLELIKELNS